MKTIIITVEDTENEIFDKIMSVLNDGKIFIKQMQFRNLKN